MEILIADSGATKTDWCLISNGEILQQYNGKGISPIFQTQDEIAEEVKLNIYPVFNKWDISRIYFYGAGCTTENIPVVKNAINQSLLINNIEVYSDIIAQHTLYVVTISITCILGTGSNSCEWMVRKS